LEFVKLRYSKASFIRKKIAPNLIIKKTLRKKFILEFFILEFVKLRYSKARFIRKRLHPT